MVLSRGWFLALMAAATLAPTYSAGQALDTTSIRIPDHIRCEKCEISIDLVATLELPAEDPTHERWRSRQILGERTHDGGFVVANQAYQAGKVFFFDRVGRLVHSVGFEPGPPTGINWLVEFPDGSMCLLDPWRSQLVVISPTGVTKDRSEMELAFPVHGEMIDGFRMVLSSPIRTPEKVGLPLHLVDRRGGPSFSFGSDSPEVRFGEESSLYRVVGRSIRGGIWSARVNRYVIEEWGLDGRFRQRVIRESEWFEAWQGPNTGRAAWLRDVREDDDGLLWTLTSIPNREPEIDWPQTPNRGADQTWDSVIEIIDPINQKVLAKIIHPQLFLSFDGDHLFTVRFEPEDYPVIEVWRLWFREEG